MSRLGAGVRARAQARWAAARFRPAAHRARLTAGLEDARLELRDTLLWLYGTGMPKSRRLPGGRGTTLKPAYEPILLARRPPEEPIARTLERHGTGALNIGACRVDGRYPANVICSHAPGCGPDRCLPGCAVALVDTAAARGRVRSNATSPASRLFYCPKVSRRERDAGCEHLPRRALDLFPQRPGRRRPLAGSQSASDGQAA